VGFRRPSGYCRCCRRTRRAGKREEEVNAHEERRCIPAGQEIGSASRASDLDVFFGRSRSAVEGQPVRCSQCAPEKVFAAMVLLEREAHAGPNRMRGRVAEDEQDRRASVLLTREEAFRAVDDRVSVTREEVAVIRGARCEFRPTCLEPRSSFAGRIQVAQIQSVAEDPRAHLVNEPPSEGRTQPASRSPCLRFSSCRGRCGRATSVRTRPSTSRLGAGSVHS
jgi:hypothetical protein